MRFKSITYNNYRCFLDGKINFSEDGERNITILIGPNGGGKTETLFSFWWVLYGFDFSTLRAKESTTYALNLELYRELERSTPGTTKSCSVIVEFEHQGTRYEVKKTCEYKKTEKRISAYEYQEFSYYYQNGEKSLPERDPDEIKKKLERIIPKSILYGIIFDGERMQRLSAANDSSKNAIKGVISDITNVELIEKCKEYFEGIKRSLNKQLKGIAKKTNRRDLDDIIDELSQKETRELELLAYIERGLEAQKNYENRCKEISQELEAYEIVKEIEGERKQEREKIEGNTKKLDMFYKDFSASLKDAYLLNSDKLLNDVDGIIQKYDVPAELTVPAVKNILKRDDCICGRPLDEQAKIILQELINSLPPDNINSTLAEVIRQFKDRKTSILTQVATNYKYIKSCETEIQQSKDKIAQLSTQISELTDGQTDEDVQHIKSIEKENRENLEKIGRLKVMIPQAEDELKETKREIQSLKKSRDEHSEGEDVSKTITAQISFIEKCTEALSVIRQTNRDTALNEINKKLSAAYQLLSEDAELGRQIKIIQHDEKMMYQLVVYMKDSYQALLQEWKQNGTYEKYERQGLTSNEIEEKVIINCIDPNSTGQSKINTFSFVKAILDYSNSKKKDEGISIQKEYPLLIDAPFGDISGGNLEKSSSALHEFTGQIILMLDKDRYNELRSNLERYISEKYEYHKIKKQHYTTIQHTGKE